MEAFDLGTLYFFGSLQRPWLNSVVMTLTHLGDYKVLTPFAAVCVLLLVYLRRPHLAVAMALIALGSLALEWSTKMLVQRPRPDVARRLIPIPQEPSFPSGHALCSMAIYTGAGLLFGRLMRRRWQAVALLALSVVLGMIVGLSRVYLGVHYPMDVFAGWIGGLACALIGVGASATSGATEGDPAPSSS